MVSVVGVDLGFAKTGLTAFHLTRDDDDLVAATTVVSEIPRKSSARQFGNLARLWNWDDQVSEFMKRWKPKALFIEIPHGGAQGARAQSCMGMITGAISMWVRYNNIPFEMYLPGDVEKCLDIKLAPDDAKGMTRNERQCWKKDRMCNVVLAEWPLFNGWPTRKAEAEDAYDSAAAFLCGRIRNNLYAKLKAQVTE